MKNLYGLISLSIMLVLFSCTKNEVTSSSVSQEMLDIKMKPVVNGDSILQNKATIY